MELHLKGRTALVTGASRGIGYGVALHLAAEGCNLNLASRNAHDLASARKRITDAHGVEVKIHALDLSREENVLKLAQACGPVDILINNAGAIPHAAITAFDDQSWKAGWDLKVFGYINLTREVYREMCASRRGVIINIAGLAGERPTANYIAGSMGNAALMAMSRALGAEGVGQGVRVIAVNPGGIATERQTESLMARAKHKFGDESRWQEFAVNRPIKRLGTVAEIADVVVFLCSDRASYISGTVITVDAGASVAI
jgi:NAD(P)-dependent dehydrogenase (short-subunit alcohol dehydrogenase family)